MNVLSLSVNWIAYARFPTSPRVSRVFIKLYKVGNIANKGLHGEEKKNAAKKLPPLGIEPRTSILSL